MNFLNKNIVYHFFNYFTIGSIFNSNLLNVTFLYNVLSIHLY